MFVGCSSSSRSRSTQSEPVAWLAFCGRSRKTCLAEPDWPGALGGERNSCTSEPSTRNSRLVLRLLKRSNMNLFGISSGNSRRLDDNLSKAFSFGFVNQDILPYLFFLRNASIICAKSYAVLTVGCDSRLQRTDIIRLYSPVVFACIDASF